MANWTLCTGPGCNAALFQYLFPILGIIMTAIIITVVFFVVTRKERGGVSKNSPRNINLFYSPKFVIFLLIGVALGAFLFYFFL